MRVMFMLMLIFRLARTFLSLGCSACKPSRCFDHQPLAVRVLQKLFQEALQPGAVCNQYLAFGHLSDISRRRLECVRINAYGDQSLYRQAIASDVLGDVGQERFDRQHLGYAGHGGRARVLPSSEPNMPRGARRRLWLRLRLRLRSKVYGDLKLILTGASSRSLS